MKKILKKICLTAALLILPGVVFAQAKLPEIMAGQTVIEGLGGASSTVEEKHSIFFDGVNDMADIPYSPDFTFANGYTILGWVKPSEVIGRHTIISSWDYRYYSNKSWRLAIVDGYLEITHNSDNNWDACVDNTAVDGCKILRTTKKLSVGIWQFVAVTYSGGTTGDNMAISINDITINLNMNVVPLDTLNQVVRIGEEEARDNSSYGGGLDEFRIFSKALDSNELASFYNKTFDPTSDSPDLFGQISYWDFLYNPANKNTIADKSGRGHNFTLKNFIPGSPLTSYWTSIDGNGYPSRTIISGGMYYGGFPGNETVYNYTQSGQLDSSGQEVLFGFQNSFTACITAILMGGLPTGNCFLTNIVSNSIPVVSSRTSVNGTSLLETAVLFYPPRTVIGDVYGNGMNNFAFWGRNLHQASGTAESDASWKMSGYTMNSEAQAKWGSDQFNKNNNKIATLKGEAPILNTNIAGAGGMWYLQGNSTLALSDNSNSDEKKYPEGKVWRISGSGFANNLTINLGATFKGVGTIIIDGDLIINSGADIKPDPAGTNRLGFIVMGNVTINGNSKIQASIYCPNNINIARSGNVELTGSFVANDFDINSTNVRFYYDYALDSSWPPGFRYLSMPHPSETKQ